MMNTSTYIWYSGHPIFYLNSTIFSSKNNLSGIQRNKLDSQKGTDIRPLCFAGADRIFFDKASIFLGAL